MIPERQAFPFGAEAYIGQFLTRLPKIGSPRFHYRLRLERPAQPKPDLRKLRGKKAQPQLVALLADPPSRQQLVLTQP